MLLATEAKVCIYKKTVRAQRIHLSRRLSRAESAPIGGFPEHCGRRKILRLARQLATSLARAVARVVISILIAQNGSRGKDSRSGVSDRLVHSTYAANARPQGSDPAGKGKDKVEAGPALSGHTPAQNRTLCIHLQRRHCW